MIELSSSSILGPRCLSLTARRYNYVGVGERAKAGEKDLSAGPITLGGQSERTMARVFAALLDASKLVECRGTNLEENYEIVTVAG